MDTEKTSPRQTPDRDSRYMGLAWIFAAFSKDPSTQVGSLVVSEDNYLLGSGYNGPPRSMKDEDIVWDRPPADDPEAFSKYDLMIHAEVNALDHCQAYGCLAGATVYVTALPCPGCMKELARKTPPPSRVVYYDYHATSGSMLKNAKLREKTFRIAEMASIRLEAFSGNLEWLSLWISHLKELVVL